MDILQVPGRLLAGNPLHDPVERRAAVFVPAQAAAGAPLPVVYWLFGFGGSSESAIRNSADWCATVQRVADHVTPCIIVTIDGRNRWGGSQYIDSPAQGNYARYLCDEVIPLIESRYRVLPGAENRLLAGHSSGGFGALRLGISHHRLFRHIISLAGDADFPTTHLPLLQRPSVRALSAADRELLKSAAPPTGPIDWSVRYTLALSAAYTPIGHSSRFDWPYTTDGQLQNRVWRRWLDNDPLTIVQRHPNAFAPEQTIYLDGGDTDGFKANIGARKVYEALRERRSRVTYFEFSGGHTSFIPLRLERGIAWSLGKPLRDIPER